MRDLFLFTERSVSWSAMPRRLAEVAHFILRVTEFNSSFEMNRANIGLTQILAMLPKRADCGATGHTQMKLAVGEVAAHVFHDITRGQDKPGRVNNEHLRLWKRALLEGDVAIIEVIDEKKLNSR
ncbi:hypothetical protein AK812_SmicGene2659 [Symbiodinium microadriaticum]|uniref:Uncharacterized protein n=1 Tax=Symbiodinium microadriaticum TaxID=2951 RepID=A0A1Q9F0P4_SYMMI|nr:hypothetical protein AK812_SmicGene2659 [Symbiodinium microadriaticum]